MRKIGVFTIASKNYLAYVRTLLASVAKIQPEYRRFLCLADQVDGYFDVDAEPYEIIQADQLGILHFKDMRVRYDIMEFNTAVKPFMFRWLFENTDLDVVIYLDPDIRVYSRFDRLEHVFDEGASVVLTPHITHPLEDGKNPNDYHMLQSGVFNLGFIAVRSCSESLEFIDWWGRRLTTQCTSDIASNLFTDQRWCDLAPCFLDNLKVFKDPGYNVAYWNLVQRQVVSVPGNGWQVNGEPLVFFHFSGVNPEDSSLVSKHQNRFIWKNIAGYKSLFESYHDELKMRGWQASSKWPYAYDGESGIFKKLPSLVRKLYHQTHPQPADLEGRCLEEYLVELCNQPADGISADGSHGITRLMALVYRLRPDLQVAFGLSEAEGRLRFTQWFEVSGEREYGLPPEVLRSEVTADGSQSMGLKKEIRKFCYQKLLAIEAFGSRHARLLPVVLQQNGKKWLKQLKSAVFKSL